MPTSWCRCGGERARARVRACFLRAHLVALVGQLAAAARAPLRGSNADFGPMRSALHVSSEAINSPAAAAPQIESLSTKVTQLEEALRSTTRDYIEGAPPGCELPATSNGCVSVPLLGDAAHCRHALAHWMCC